MLGDDAPAMDAPAILAAGMSNAGLATRPVFSIGPQPGASVIMVEVTVKAPE